MKTLPEILGDSSSEWCGCYEGDMDNRFPEMKAEAIESITKELMGIIGEDEDMTKPYEEGGADIAYSRNKLRANQRARLTAFIGHKEK